MYCFIVLFIFGRAGEAELGAEEGPAEGEDGVVGGDLGVLVAGEQPASGIVPVKDIGADKNCGRQMSDYAPGLAPGGVCSGEIHNIVGAGARRRFYGSEEIAAPR